MTFRFGEGQFFQYRCKACDRTNGGGISCPEYNKAREVDIHSPHHNPCVWCKEGPVVIELLNKFSNGEEI